MMNSISLNYAIFVASDLPVLSNLCLELVTKHKEVKQELIEALGPAFNRNPVQVVQRMRVLIKNQNAANWSTERRYFINIEDHQIITLGMKKKIRKQVLACTLIYASEGQGLEKLRRMIDAASRDTFKKATAKNGRFVQCL
ncbi:unnamed protein product [Caenorhabditis angaria]|uniref:Uncharacterized protein n=1 Tax=Caenorhabditis angaria TaxID=860376 RepID=A0A9P1I0U7_9PELO|nr:unnamed protein product [Caenorhabditis angaria]